ncbi:DUF2384 domain-containing protein [Sphingobacterium sp. SGG-5]|uniref:type II RES/Xre toxin-antitoxin system antitoxin n=1 Tax=Sphingobacterium sp. SGG-5 TaxID=2710881 RepID=UPI0013EAC7A0|nr:antitoxin Xre/MbcA/ParS toxin-binding domain-containing protein [Sphingobacterium sp. SGG-5]NGM61280.1 DUF2384 domain-containing protein [Sphingobacterium sp. SGG-5]
MAKKTTNTRPFHIPEDISNVAKEGAMAWVPGVANPWINMLDRVQIIRNGLPFEAIEELSKKINIPVKSVLSIIRMPQTTYNKKKNEQSLLDSHNTELILLIKELISYGVDVFNGEEQKFQRWLKKPNISLGGYAPDSLLDTVTGIQEVRSCLDRLEYGVFA